MTVESAKAFYLRMGTDEAFMAQLDSASPEERINIAREAGYDFTQEDFEAATVQVLESDELTEDQLETVAGGVIGYARLNIGGLLSRYGKAYLFGKR